jgi:7-carboxy-7-deazaguanine synthase
LTLPAAEENRLQITEIFKSIQGESTRAGFPCSFVRLTGCSLRCVWCDSAYAFHGGRSVSLDEIVREVEGHATDLVELTGGEPLEQEGVYPLATRLLDAGKTVLVETGARGDDRLDPGPSPSSTSGAGERMERHNLPENLVSSGRMTS